VGTSKENIKTSIAVKLPNRLKVLDVNPKMELKNKLTNGIVRPAPMDISINGDIALNIIFQS
jgi:hypothetical protein